MRARAGNNIKRPCPPVSLNVCLEHASLLIFPLLCMFLPGLPPSLERKPCTSSHSRILVSPFLPPASSSHGRSFRPINTLIDFAVNPFQGVCVEAPTHTLSLNPFRKSRLETSLPPARSLLLSTASARAVSFEGIWKGYSAMCVLVNFCHLLRAQRSLLHGSCPGRLTAMVAGAEIEEVEAGGLGGL